MLVGSLVRLLTWRLNEENVVVSACPHKEFWWNGKARFADMDGVVLDIRCLARSLSRGGASSFKSPSPDFTPSLLIVAGNSSG